MEQAGRGLIFPTKADLVELNRSHAKRGKALHRGGDNIRDVSTLEWVLDAIQYPLFDSDLFPSIVDKACALAWYIAGSQIFFDANKRTGIAAMLTFLNVNAYSLNASIDDLEEIAKRVANSRTIGFRYSDFQEWVRSRIILSP